jgi:dTDP-4-dehydrorhamnose 3,5-epimerase
MKMVRCIKGRVFDVAIDLRRNSKTYLKWYGVELSEKNMKLFVLPEGFAHGFQTLEDDVEMLYLHTEFYNKESEGAVRYNDPSVSIHWPKEITEISEKDAAHPLIDDRFPGVML